MQCVRIAHYFLDYVPPSKSPKTRPLETTFEPGNLRGPNSKRLGTTFLSQIMLQVVPFGERMAGKLGVGNPGEAEMQKVGLGLSSG